MKILKNSFPYFGFIFFSFSIPLKAVEIITQPRFYFEINKKLNKKTELIFQEELRFRRIQFLKNGNFVTLALNRDFKRGWDIEPGYRFEYEIDGNSVFQPRHRIHLDFKKGFKFNKDRLRFKVRFQKQYRQKSDSSKQPEKVRIKGSYKLHHSSVAFRFSAEVFFRTNDLRPFLTEDNLRIKLGKKFKVNKRESINIDYAFDTSLHPLAYAFKGRTPYTQITFLGYQFNFK